MPDALSLLNLVTQAATSLVSLTTTVVRSVGSVISTVLSAGRTIVTELVKIGGSIGQVVGATVTAAIALGRNVVTIVGAIVQVGVAIGRVVGPIISGVISTITAASSVASSIVGAISSGISAVSGVFGSIVSTISGIVSSISGVFGSIVSTVSGVVGSLSSVFASVGPVFSSAVTVIGGAFSAIAGAAGAFMGAIGGAASGIIGAVTSIVGALASVVGAVTSAFQSIGQALGGVASVAGSAISAFASAVQSCVESLMTFANNVTGITAQTGMSISGAAKLTTDLGAVGISGGEASKIFGSLEMRPDLFNARSGAVGLARMDDPNFLPKEAELYQAKVRTEGLPAARAQLDAQFNGKVPDAILRLVNKDPQTLRENLNYGREVQGQMGVGPGEIKAASEDLPLLMNRVSTFVETVKMRFAADLLPSLEAAFSVVSNVLKDNAGTISNLLQSATRAIFVDGPDMAANAALTALDWGSALVDMFASVAEAGISLIETFGNRDGALYGILMAGARFIDFMGSVAAQISGAIAFIQASFELSVHNFITGIIAAIMGPLSLIPGAVDQAKGLFDQFTGFEFDAVDPFQAYHDAVDNGTKFNAEDSVSGLADSAKNIDTQKLRANVQGAQTDAHAALDSVRGNVTDLHDRFKNTKKDYDDRLLAVNQQQLAIAKEHLDVAKGTTSGSGSAGQILARMGAYLAQDAYRLTSR